MTQIALGNFNHKSFKTPKTHPSKSYPWLSRRLRRTSALLYSFSAGFSMTYPKLEDSFRRSDIDIGGGCFRSSGFDDFIIFISRSMISDSRSNIHCASVLFPISGLRVPNQLHKYGSPLSLSLSPAFPKSE